uniref:Uncharacterized protein n=1 Tax=viral metagenome TaxID=1070528 RepID=A0A6H1ZF63_9ZZZZ
MNEKSKEEVEAEVKVKINFDERSLEMMDMAMFSGEFVDMVAMRALHALEERLAADAESLQLVNSMYMLLLYERYIGENKEGLTEWYNNQAAAEAIGEISKLVRWEVE